MKKMIRIGTIFLCFIALGSCEDGFWGKPEMEQSLLKKITHLRSDSTLFAEIEFFYNEEDMLDSSFMSIYYESAIETLTVPTVYVRDENKRLIRVEEFSGSPTQISYVDDKIVSLKNEYNEFSTREITIFYNSHGEVVDSYSYRYMAVNYDAELVLDEYSNILSLEDPATGGESAEIRRMGNHEYDSRRSVFENFGYDIRIIWNFGPIAGALGEMLYSNGENNRIKSTKDKGNSIEVVEFYHRYNDLEKPYESYFTRSNILSETGDTLSQFTEKYVYSYY